MDNLNNQQPETLNGQRKVTELPVGNEAVKQQHEQVPVDDNRIHEHRYEVTESQPADYDTIMENINPNDKIL